MTIHGIWNDAPLGERWRAAFASRPSVDAPPDLVFELTLVDEAPPAPPSVPDFTQGSLLAYYLRGGEVTAHFPRFGQLRLDLAAGATEGRLTPSALAEPGVFEDLLAIGLSPHFRRRGMFLLHALAAALETGPSGESAAALLVGDIGAGKTTTGLALLQAGWKLLSNDSPILSAGTGLRVLAYPGLMSAYADTIARFPALAGLAASTPAGKKVAFAAEAAFGDVWRASAPPRAICFPQIESRADHTLDPLPPAEALARLLPHAVEQWDREMIPAHLKLLGRLVQSAPAYVLRLGAEVQSLPAVIARTLAQAS